MIAVDTNILVYAHREDSPDRKIRLSAMKSSEVLQCIKNAFKRFWGDDRFPQLSEIKEPTIEDVFGICCGPRLLSKSLKLHGEDFSGECVEDRSQDKDPKRP